MAISQNFIKRANLNNDIKAALKALVLLIDAAITAAIAAYGVAPKVRTATAAGSITAADHGYTIFLNSATGFATALPAPIAGFRCRVVSKLANTSGNHTVVTDASANIINGIQVMAADAAGDTGTTDDTINFVANQSTAGDMVDLSSDGTTWFAVATSKIAAAMTFTTAS